MDNEHKELEQVLLDAGIPVPITLSERLMSMLQTLNDIKLKEFEVKTCFDLIEIIEYQGNDATETENLHEELEHELRDFKNKFNRQEYLLHEAMKTTDEV